HNSVSIINGKVDSWSIDKSQEYLPHFEPIPSNGDLHASQIDLIWISRIPVYSVTEFDASLFHSKSSYFEVNSQAMNDSCGSLFAGSFGAHSCSSMEFAKCWIVLMTRSQTSGSRSSRMSSSNSSVALSIAHCKSNACSFVSSNFTHTLDIDNLAD